MSGCPAVNRWRSWCLVTAAVLVISLIGPIDTTSGVAAQSAAEPVDLAALLPSIVDVEDGGLEGLVGSYGVDTDSVERFAAVSQLKSDDPVIGELTNAGFVRNYQTYWVDREAEDAYLAGEPYVPAIMLRFYAFQFADEAGAGAGFAALEAGDTDLDVDLGLGNQSEVSELPPYTPPGGAELTGVDLSVQVGALELGVSILSQESSAIHDDALNLTTALMTTFANRVAALGELPTDGPGLDVARFQTPTAENVSTYYLYRDGKTAWAFSGQTPEEREMDTAGAVADGGVSRYDYSDSLTTDELADQAFGYIISAGTATWETAEQASAYRDGYATSLDGYDVTVLDGAPSLGDGTVALQFVDADKTDFITSVVWSEGTVSYRVSIELPNRSAAPNAVYALAAAQTDCLAAGSCWQYQTLPAEVLNDAGPLVGPAATPMAGATLDPPDNATPEADRQPAG